ncbi:hypothetical protein GCM10023187_03360 [Nibrella viscosa]|uniref:Tetratricopeptide repeat-containing protein n=1 Tax=Nibrella viscosa TaxID=1084524 RepID=A0ABP8JTP4_9BACT
MEQAVALFRKHYTRPQLQEQDIRELIMAVDYHTLTVELLAKTAQVQRYDAATLRQAVERDLRANVEVSRQSTTVEKVGTYLRTVFSMSRLSETEIWLLKQFACLPAEFLSYDLLKALLINEESPYADVFAETLAELTRKGWLLQQADTDSYKMHAIIGEVVRTEHPIRPADVEDLLSAITQRLRIDQTKDNPVDKFIWIPYGNALLGAIHDDSGELSTLQNNLAVVLQALGDYEGARQLLEKALQSDEKNFGPDHPTTAVSSSNLALVLQALGDYKRALELSGKALAIFKKALPPGHPYIQTVAEIYQAILADIAQSPKSPKR